MIKMYLENKEIENLHPLLKERDELIKKIESSLARFDVKITLLDRICEINVEINRMLHEYDRRMKRNV